MPTYEYDYLYSYTVMTLTYYVCPFCGGMFYSLDDLQNHIMREHSIVKVAWRWSSNEK